MAFKLKTERKLWVYKCEKCGGETDYLIRLPAHLLTHLEPYHAPCEGELKLIKVKDAPLSNNQEQG
jgi:hypothetical protein